MGGWLRIDYNANSVQLLLQLPTGTELGKMKKFHQCEKIKPSSVAGEQLPGSGLGEEMFNIRIARIPY